MKKKYPEFKTWQLLLYKGNNPFVLEVKNRYMKSYDFTLSIDNITVIKGYTGVNVFLMSLKTKFTNNFNYKLNIEEVAGFLRYAGNQHFIKRVANGFRSTSSFSLTEYENEYLIKNFRYKGFRFDSIKVKVGKKTVDRIHKEFNITRKISVIPCDEIAGETEHWYHVSRPTQTGRQYVWFHKDDVGDLYEQVYMSEEIDFVALEKQFLFELYEHQKKGIHFLNYNKKSFLFDTVGNGKTHTSIGAALAAGCQKVLIVCISGKKIDWKRELLKWGQDSKVINGTKTPKKQKKGEIKGWIEEEKRFTILNFEILTSYCELKTRKKSTEDLYRPLLEEGFDCIIIDEIQKIKNPAAARSKAMIQITSQDSVEYVWGLSATPIERNIDFYNICKNLGMDISDLVYNTNHHYTKWYSKYEEFLETYCHGFKIVPKSNKRGFWSLGKKIDGVKVENDNTYELHQRVKHIQLRRRTEHSIKGFPDKIRSTLYFTLNSKERQEYDVIFDNYLKAKELMNNSDKTLKTAFKVLRAKVDKKNLDTILYKYIGQFHKIKEGAEKFHDGHEKMVIKYVDGAIERLKKAVENKRNIKDFEIKKLGNLEESRVLIETILLRQYLAIKKVAHTVKSIKSDIEDGKNVIVFTHFIEEYKLLTEKLEKYVVRVDSGWTALKKQAAIDEFMNNPDKRVIAGNIITLGTGHNITKADCVYFNSPDWNGGEHNQAEGRAWRIGRKKDVEVWYQIFDETIEERVLEKAESKKDNTAIFFGEEVEEMD